MTEHDQSADDNREFTFEETETDISDFSASDLPGLIALWALSIIVFLQFFTRYVLNDSLAWTEEIARYVLVLMVFWGAISVTRKGSHIFLEFFYRYLSPKAAKALTIFVEGLSFLFYAGLVYQGVVIAQTTKLKMASVGLPRAYLYAAVTLGIVFIACFSFRVLLKRWRQTPDEVMTDIQNSALKEADLMTGEVQK